MPTVAVGSLGGTITMTSTPGRTGVTPTADADDLVATVPGLSEVAEVRAETLLSAPGASLTFEDLLRCLVWAREAVDSGAAGVVLVQGTDTLEESAFLLDLFWDRPNPLVLTGAMRPPQQAGADGPANLLAAVRLAAAPLARDTGVLVTLNDEVHAASRVRKTDTSALHAFVSPGWGPVGRVVEGRVVLPGHVLRPRPLPVPDRDRGIRVALLESCLDDRGELISLVATSGFQGVVLAALGAGHVSQPAAEAVSGAVPQMPVVVSSRTGAGRTLTGTYGFPGSESDLRSRGAVLSGWLDARKARLLLWAVLTLGYDDRAIRQEFQRRGAQGGDRPSDA
ncbi:MAG: asparaginase [Actinomycetota bacterium]|nr:asparaginase [Actinomycetota bacterium]